MWLYALQVVSLKPKFVPKGRPALYIRNNKLITQGKQLETCFCIEYIVVAFKTAIYDIRVFLFRTLLHLEHTVRNIFILSSRPDLTSGLHVFKENLKVYI